MDQQEIINRLEARAKLVGLPMSEACKRAGIHPTTFSRWKQSEKNPAPKGATISSVSKLETVIAAHEREVVERVRAA
ncbi:hypothetical protein [Phenylobacterium sp.]|uniref:hypothetical protein n=1 Tax=Phenylobacterium sp. TaxID=1871053 RepID=UPI0027286726|nr:hypothetical protein [Phenylobacterium sp.]MDO8800079.1 hypothetical protein [Phenylobacterium sp.]